MLMFACFAAQDFKAYPIVAEEDAKEKTSAKKEAFGSNLGLKTHIVNSCVSGRNGDKRIRIAMSRMRCKKTSFCL